MPQQSDQRVTAKHINLRSRTAKLVAMTATKLAVLPVALLLLSACALGSEPTPGCRLDHPDDCDSGWNCRAGACVRSTTSTTQLPDSGSVDASSFDANRDTMTDQDAVVENDSASIDSPSDSASSDSAASDGADEDADETSF